jgi:hypothetical protein
MTTSSMASLTFEFVVNNGLHQKFYPKYYTIVSKKKKKWLKPSVVNRFKCCLENKLKVSTQWSDCAIDTTLKTLK